MINLVIDLLAVILIIVFGLTVIFLVLSFIFAILYSFSDSYSFEHFFESASKTCLEAAYILFAAGLLLLIGLGVIKRITFSGGA